MKEAKGNMWDADTNVFVITTNGFVKKNGEAVMGRGCAKEASQFWPEFPIWLGQALKLWGNKLYIWEPEPGGIVVTFPVKHNWYDKADIQLIETSAYELRKEANIQEWNKIVMPRPGCGNGQLNWDNVKPILEKYLDERFIVYDY